MSDYLSNLVARNLNLTAVIQPRLASVFEPPDAAGGKVFGQRLGSGLLDIGPAFDETELSNLAPAPPLARPPVGAPPESQLPVTAPDVSFHMPHQPPGGLTTRADLHSGHLTAQKPPPPTSQPLLGAAQPASLETPVPILQPVAGQPPVRRAPQEPAPSQPDLIPAPAADETGATPPPSAIEQHRRSVLEPAITRIVVERVAAPAEPRPPAARDETGTTPNHSPTESQRQPKLAIQRVAVERTAMPAEPRPPAIAHSESPPVQPTRPSAPATTAVEPRVTPYVKPSARARAEPAATPKPAPTIQVTIGRIEVRATPPPAPPQKQRSAPPVMSLDEYLRQRARRGDR
jgi:hypothetical protein